MSCEHVSPKILGYHLAILSPDERREVEAHLLRCLGCVGELVAHKRALEVEGPPPPPAAKARVRAAVFATMAGRRRPASRWERPFALAAAAVLLVVAARLTTLLTGGEGAAPRGGHAGVARVAEWTEWDRPAVAVARQRSHSLPSGSSTASNGSARTTSSPECVAITRYVSPSSRCTSRVLTVGLTNQRY